jgi:hypothetical protein
MQLRLRLQLPLPAASYSALLRGLTGWRQFALSSAAAAARVLLRRAAMLHA